MIALIVGGACLLVVLILIWSIYNGLIRAKNQVDEALGMIDVHLKKRFELIPNLIEAVKGYNEHEASVLSSIVEKRGSIPEDPNAKAKFDTNITDTLRSFRIHVEDYPDLKANTQFLKLMDSLSMVEDELAMARRYYNGTVRDLNNRKEVFPNVLFAGMFGIKDHAFYEINSGESERPEVELNSDS